MIGIDSSTQEINDRQKEGTKESYGASRLDDKTMNSIPLHGNKCFLRDSRYLFMEINNCGVVHL